MQKTWIDIGHDDLSIRRQSVLLRVNRNRLEVKPRKQTSVDLEICREIDELHLKHPQFGSRSMSTHLKKRGYSVGRGKARRLMRMMDLTAIYPKPRTSVKSKKN